MAVLIPALCVLGYCAVGALAGWVAARLAVRSEDDATVGDAAQTWLVLVVWWPVVVPCWGVYRLARRIGKAAIDAEAAS